MVLSLILLVVKSWEKCTVHFHVHKSSHWPLIPEHLRTVPMFHVMEREREEERVNTSSYVFYNTINYATMSFPRTLFPFHSLFLSLSFPNFHPRLWISLFVWTKKFVFVYSTLNTPFPLRWTPKCIPSRKKPIEIQLNLSF